MVAKQLKDDTARGAQIAKPPFKRIFTGQCTVLVCMSAGLLLVDVVIAYSTLLGGLISVAPNVYFASLGFRYSGARAANDVAKSLYRGEVGKFVLTALLFACVFVLVKPLSAAALFATFIFMMVLNWVLLVRFSHLSP